VDRSVDWSAVVILLAMSAGSLLIGELRLLSSSLSAILSR
jgi:hypothetical protein